MEVLQLSFLGGFHCAHQEKGEIIFSRRKVIGLLAFLALEAGQGHSRESLMGLLWPDLPEADARNNLRVSLSHLRNRLKGMKTAVTSTRHDIRFDFNESITLDVADWQSLIASTESHSHSSRATCAVCQAQLTQAVDLYRGPLLPGFFLDDCETFAEWLFVQRERLHLQVLEVLGELAQGLMDNGRYAEATRYTRRQLELEPLHDGAQHTLLRLLAYQGQHNKALNRYQTFKSVLSDELGIEPDAEMRQLVQQIETRTLPLPHDEPADTLTLIRHNLPENLTPFIGRETELRQLAERLATPTYRLITLVGPGGIGKTRLAIEAARAQQAAFGDGVFFVPLEGVTSAAEISATIAKVLGVTLGGGDSPQTEVVRMVQDKQLLLLIDNLEHVLEAGAELLLAMLQAAPDLLLLVTSRERLNAQVEDLFRLSGLEYPPTNDEPDSTRYAAVRLFADRAHRLNKTFRLSSDNLHAVSDICRLVEGLPLGLELAATWVRDFSVQQIATSLADDIDLLATDLRDISPRHRNIATVFEYSWQLLTADEQAILPCLAVFRGGFTLAAAKQVTGASPLTLVRLRYKSLIRGAGNGRYQMHELLRQLAMRKLQENPATFQQVQSRQSYYFLTLVEAEAAQLTGHEAAQTADRLGRDLDNIRYGWRWAVAEGELALLQRSAAGFAMLFDHMGLNFDGAALLATAVNAPAVQTAADPNLMPTLLSKQLFLLQPISTLDKIKLLIERILTLTEDKPPLANQRAEAYLFWCMSLLKQAADPREAHVYLDYALATLKSSHRPELKAIVTCELGNNYLYEGKFDEAIAVLQQSLATFESLAHVLGQALAYSRLAPAYAESYNLGQALVCDREALRLYTLIDYRPRLTVAHHNLAETYVLVGAYEQAKEQVLHTLKMSGQQGNKILGANSASLYALILDKLGQDEEADKAYRSSIVALRALKLNFSLRFTLLNWGDFQLNKGWLEEAEITFEDALSINKDTEHLRLMTQAKLAQVYMAQKKNQLAWALADEVWRAIAPTKGQGLSYPIDTTGECYLVFHACGDERALAALQMAADVRKRTAVGIEDTEMRQLFLADVPRNSQLRAAMLKSAV